MDEIGIFIVSDKTRDLFFLTLGVENNRFFQSAGQLQLGAENLLLLGKRNVAPDAVHADFTDDGGLEKPGLHVPEGDISCLPWMKAQGGQKNWGEWRMFAQKHEALSFLRCSCADEGGDIFPLSGEKLLLISQMSMGIKQSHVLSLLSL